MSHYVKIDTSSEMLGMVSTCFILVMLELELGCRVVNWKVYKDCVGSKVLHKDWHKSDTEGIVVTDCGHVLYKVITSKYQQHMLQMSGMIEVWLHVTSAFLILEKWQE